MYEKLAYCILFFIVVLILLILFLLGIQLISIEARAEPWQFKIQNDFVIPKGLDRNLTNAFELKVGAFAFGNEMYTPTSKKSQEKPIGDRPWSGYTYLEYQIIRPLENGAEWDLKSRLGLVGNASGTKALQRFVHDDLGMGVHPAWVFQNPSEPTVDFISTKRIKTNIESILGYAQMKEEYGVRVGTVNDSFFLDQELRRNFFHYIFPYVGVKGEAVLYDTHLDGRLFHSNNYTTNKEWLVATARGGIEFYVPQWDIFIDYHYEYETQRFSSQKGRHSYGSLSFGRKF